MDDLSPELIEAILSGASSTEELDQLAAQLEQARAMQGGVGLPGIRAYGRMARAASPLEMAGELAKAYALRKREENLMAERKPHIEALKENRMDYVNALRNRAAQREAVTGDLGPITTGLSAYPPPTWS